VGVDLLFSLGWGVGVVLFFLGRFVVGGERSGGVAELGRRVFGRASAVLSRGGGVCFVAFVMGTA